MDYIEAFFEVLNDKVAFLRQLFDSSRQDEAMTLCCAYIDGLGQALYFPDKRSSFNFVRALREYGGQPYLDLFHPAGFSRWVKTQTKFRKLSAKIDSAMAIFKGQLASEADLKHALSQTLSDNELQDISTELWHGTLAYSAYKWLRNPFVHTLRGYGGVSFGQIIYDGRPVPEIDFFMLHGALESIVRNAHEISIKSGKLCGHGCSRKRKE